LEVPAAGLSILTPKIPADGRHGVVSGMSAIRMPFQECGRLIPHGKGHATMLVQPSVVPGSTVRIIIDDQVYRGRVKSVSRHREHGKWRVLLQFS
jgi:hypothetical protein